VLADAVDVGVVKSRMDRQAEKFAAARLEVRGTKCEG
jgi:hypothetical protein